MPTFNPNAESMEPISVAESARLNELEKTIKDGLRTFVAVGTALAEIRDSRLYRAEYPSFDNYVQAALGIKKSYAYQIIESAGAAKSVSAIADIKNEAQARELARVPEPRRVEVLAAAGDQPTARGIKEAAVEVLAPNPKRKYTKRNLPAVSGPPAGSANARSAVTPPAADSLQGGATAARLAHNQEVGGSIPSPATNLPDSRLVAPPAQAGAGSPPAPAQPAKLVSDEMVARQMADCYFFAIQFEEIASAVVDDGTDEQLEAAVQAAKKAVEDVQAEQKQRGEL